MRHKCEQGNKSECFVLGAYLTAGFQVSIPFGSGIAYDLVVDPGDGFPLFKVQVKTGWLSDGRILYKARRKGGLNWKSERKYNPGDVDWFVIFVPELNQLYAVPADGHVAEGSLRINDPRNKQFKNVRWASG